MNPRILVALTVLFLLMIACGTSATGTVSPQATEAASGLAEMTNVPDPQTTAPVGQCVDIPTREAGEILDRGSVYLAHQQSYDFITDEFGWLDGGDLYYHVDTLPQFWANNDPQQGGLDLGKPCVPDLPLETVVIPPDREQYSRGGVPVIVAHVYVYLQSTVGYVVVFRVTALEPEAGAYLEYVVVQGP